MGGGFTRRLRWAEAPAAVRGAVASMCGAAVLSGRDVHGGMTPGPAAVVTLEGGRRVFVKAVSEAAEASYVAYRREGVTLGVLPVGTPVPRLVGAVAVGEWFVLVMSVAAGEPAGPPWDAAGVRAVARACAAVGATAAPAGVPRIAELLTDLDGWELVTPADDWERRHIAALRAAAGGWREWTVGAALVHQDVRGDNALVDGSNATLVDWSFGCAGAGWLDRARLAADVVCSGHRDGPAEAVRTARALLAELPGGERFVAALAGMWRYRSTLPELPGLPGLRGWQQERARAVRSLLEQILQT